MKNEERDEKFNFLGDDEDIANEEEREEYSEEKDDEVKDELVEGNVKRKKHHHKHNKNRNRNDFNDYDDNDDFNDEFERHENHYEKEESDYDDVPEYDDRNDKYDDDKENHNDHNHDHNYDYHHEEDEHDEDYSNKHEEDVHKEENSDEYNAEKNDSFPVKEEKEEVEESFEDFRKSYKESNEEHKVENNSSQINNNVNSGFYVSYEMRVMLMVLLSILFLGIASAFIIEAVTYNESKSVNYSEKSDVDYKVCLEENTDYSENCLGQDMQYLSLITKNIPITFNYDVKLSNPIDYELRYYVVGSLKIVDRDDNQKVLYTKENVLVPDTKISNQSDTIQFSSNVDVDFKTYNNYVTGYKSRYSLNSEAYLDVILYINESTGPRRVSSLTIPLGVQTYGISKSQTLNNNKNVVIEDRKWTNRNYIAALIGTVCALVGIVIIIKLISLVLKVSTVKSKYQRKLNQILREYDRVIVVARNGYELNENKKLIKVLSFNELLDARDALEKPIVYVKVNEVKSEFYVEDVDKVYLYVMKEADF